IKYERVRTLEGKKLIVVAGSSTLYGLDSKLMEEKMPGYNVVNYGTNGSSTALLFLYAMSNYVNPGDIIIHAPCMWSGGALGMSSIAWELFREDEQCWDIFREVDMTLFSGFFDAYSLYTNGSDAVAAAKNMEGKPYQLLDCGLNKYGDIDYDLNKTTYTPGRGDISDFNVDALQVANLNRFNDLMIKKGVTYLYSFATQNFTNYVYAYDDAGNQIDSHDQASAMRLQVFRHRCDDYTAKCKELFDFPVISNVYDYILDSHYFSNSDWHCTNACQFNGRKLRTEQLASDLQKYFEEKEQYEKQNSRFVVTIQNCDGVKFKSDSTVTVKYGEKAEFKISVDDKHIYIGNSINAKYNEKTHKIIVENVTSSMTIILDVMKTSDMIHVEVVNDNVNCDVTFAEGKEYLINPEKVTLVASSGGRYTFEGWSSGNYLAKGGKLISSDTTYSFNADKSVKIYANFVDTGNYTITYHANGGVYTATGADTYKYTGQYSSIFPMQNTLENDGYFKRDGYVAVGYSTSPVNFEDYGSVNDIPGFSNMGGVCLVGDSGELDLYVVWAKETPASSFTFSNGAITKYNGNDKIVVVPATINGAAVKTIKSGAFYNKISTYTVVIPPCMETVESGAFQNVALKQFVFFDTLLNISDDSFPNSLNNLKTVVLDAARLPKYSGSSEGSFCVKYERVRTLTGKKIIVMAGSSTLYGLDSAVMERQFPGYSVVNYGTNGSSTGLFFLDACCNYCGEGDIVIDAPCYWSGAQLGSNVMAWELFREDEQCWDIFREVNMSEYTNFFSAYSLYMNGSSSVAAAKNMGGKKYQIAECGLNKYGDVSTVYASTVYSVGGPSSKLSNNLNSTNLNKMNKKFLAKGTTMLFSYATYNFARSAFAYNAVGTPIKFKDELGGHWKNDFYNDCAEHDKYCQSVLDFPVISKIRNYIMD
ncbi:MAG: leucine-rich repeat protein, partial [Firmicutes bacterium]|nr:leucine-rich repeat protein [Candidatus Colimorpha enterica]